MSAPAVLANIDAAMVALGRKLDQQRRRVRAEGYERQGYANQLLLRRFLSADLFAAAMGFPAYTPTTWAVIRHLCAVKRRMAKLLSAAEMDALRSTITCEIHLLARQRAAMRQRVAAE